MKNKGLGRGLESLFGGFQDDDLIKENPAQNKMNLNENTTSVELRLIDTNKNQPRKNFDAAALKELADSIKIHGVIQPIIVTKNKERYTIIAGERRFRAAKIAGLKEIPVIIREYNEQQIKEIALLENIQREDLNPIEVAKAMKELLEVYNWTQDFLAERLGKSRPAVANTLRLLSLQPEVIEMIVCGKLSAGHARSLVVVTDPEAQIKLAKIAISKKVTVRDLEKTIQDIKNPKTKKAKAEPSLEMKQLISLMQKKLATKVGFMGTEKRGRIYIDYYSQDDLERIFETISK